MRALLLLLLPTFAGCAAMGEMISSVGSFVASEEGQEVAKNVEAVVEGTPLAAFAKPVGIAVVGAVGICLWLFGRKGKKK